MNPDVITLVRLMLGDTPAPAERVAERANLGRSQTYQALVHLHDRGLAHIVTQADRFKHHKVAGWTS